MVNGLEQGRGEAVTLIPWVMSPLLVYRDTGFYTMVEGARRPVHVSACEACADELGVLEFWARQYVR